MMGRLSLALLLASAPGVTASGFVPGGVCDGANYSRPTNELLIGKHLIIYEANWYPLAYEDPTQPEGWNGFDIDLLRTVAFLLGFTFEIRKMEPLPGENSWTPMLLRTASMGDIIGTYWLSTPSRINHPDIFPLTGHIDMTNVLVGRLQEAPALTGVDWIFSFMRPFSYPLWGCLVLIIILSGFMDYLLEIGSETGASLKASLYEYTAGFLWGGFEYPRSNFSGLYQVTLGFILLVTASTYTANLAAVMTVSVVSTNSATSVEDAAVRATPVCSYPNPLLEQFDNLYPSVNYKIHRFGQVAKLLADDQGCDAVLAPKVSYDVWRTNPAFCKLRVAQNVLNARSAGWVTNRQSLCVQLPINWAIVYLQKEGIIDRFHKKWLPQSPCDQTKASGGDGDDSVDDDGVGNVANRRQLKGGSGGADGGGAEGGSSSGAPPNAIPQIGLSEFIGVFIVWGVVTVAAIIQLIVNRYAKRVLRCGLRCRKRLSTKIHGKENTEQGRMAKFLRQASIIRRKDIQAIQMPQEPIPTPAGQTAWRKLSLATRANAAMGGLGKMANGEIKKAPSVFDLRDVNFNDANGMLHRLLKQMAEIDARLPPKGDQQPSAEPTPAAVNPMRSMMKMAVSAEKMAVAAAKQAKDGAVIATASAGSVAVTAAKQAKDGAAVVMESSEKLAAAAARQAKEGAVVAANAGAMARAASARQFLHVDSAAGSSHSNPGSCSPNSCSPQSCGPQPCSPLPIHAVQQGTSFLDSSPGKTAIAAVLDSPGKIEAAAAQQATEGAIIPDTMEPGHIVLMKL